MGAHPLNPFNPRLFPRNLRADPCDGLTPVGIARVGYGTDLKSVGRAGGQPGYRCRRFGLADRLLGPISGCSARTDRRPAQLIAERVLTGHERHQHVTAVLTRSDLTDRIRYGL